MTRLQRCLLVLGLVTAVAACGDDTSGGEDPDDSNQSQQESYDGPTYHGDIAPMMDEHCTECHVPDDIAPFALETYDEVEATSTLSLNSMKNGTMPPWPPDDECADFQNHRGISEGEISTFEEWIDAGHPEGDPDEAPEDGGQDTGSEGIDGDPDLTVDWGFDYQPEPPEGSVDDYRCFVIEPDIEDDRYINLMHTRPDNAEIVHHMIAFSAPADAAGRIEDLEAEDDRPGYECFGTPRIDNAAWLSGWAPGETPTPFEDGHGVLLEEDAHVIVQMHYNTINDPQGTDRTEIDVYFVDEEEHAEPSELMMIPFPVTDLFLEAGDPNAEAHGTSPEIPSDLIVHGVFPHMHLLGTEIRVDGEGADGEQCLVDVPQWDFDWQGFYMYEEPVELADPVTLEMTCKYDNSPGNQPDGRSPQDVTWGDGTYDEMCLVILVVEVTPELRLLMEQMSG